MSYLGHVKNGVVVFDERVDLPDGAPVKVDLLGEASSKGAEKPQKLPADTRAYFGIIRWLAFDSGIWGKTGKDEELAVLSVTAVLFTIYSIFAVPFVLNMIESLLWFAVWLQKRPAVRGLLKRSARRHPK